MCHGLMGGKNLMKISRPMDLSEMVWEYSRGVSKWFVDEVSSKLTKVNLIKIWELVVDLGSDFEEFLVNSLSWGVQNMIKLVNIQIYNCGVTN